MVTAIRYLIPNIDIGKNDIPPPLHLAKEELMEIMQSMLLVVRDLDQQPWLRYSLLDPKHSGKANVGLKKLGKRGRPKKADTTTWFCSVRFCSLGKPFHEE